MRRYVLFAAVFLALLVPAFAASVSIGYGDVVSRSYELNDTYALDVTVSGVPAHVHQVYVYPDDSLTGHVYCAPGVVSHDANESWDAHFTCVFLVGNYSGDLYFKPQNIDFDANGNPLATAKTTRLSLSVVKKQVVYTNYGYTNIGGSITVGSYKVEVDDADVVSADVTIYKGSTPVYAGVVFIGQEVKPSDDITIIFNGYSEKRGEAFFTFKTTFPVSVASSVQKYYVVAPSVVYASGDTNSSRIDVVTNCPKISVCDANGTCDTVSVPDSGKYSFTAKPGDYTIKCEGTDKKVDVHVLRPVVITKTVTKTEKPDPNTYCPSWFYSLSPASKATYCSSVTGTQPTTSYVPRSENTYAKWLGIAILLAIIGWYVWKKYKEGGLSLGGGSKSFEESEKEVEAVPDIEG